MLKTVKIHSQANIKFLELPFFFFFSHGPLPGGPEIQPGLNPGAWAEWAEAGPWQAFFLFFLFFLFSSKTVTFYNP